MGAIQRYSNTLNILRLICFRRLWYFNNLRTKSDFSLLVGDYFLEPFFQVVELLAHHILTRREIKFPDSENVAKAFGDALVKDCLDDPDELLYSVVSRSLRDTLPVE